MNNDGLDELELAVAAQFDFQRARRKALLNRFVSALRRRPASLVSIAEAKRGLSCCQQRYAGLQQVPVASIVGSVDRFGEFDREFNPLRVDTRSRWESVDRAVLSDVPLPPVRLYKLGDAYFVIDGHHRTSVARYRGVGYIDAEVIEYGAIPRGAA